MSPSSGWPLLLLSLSCTLLAVGLLHRLSRTVVTRLATYLPILELADRVIVYGVVYTAGLVGSIHLAAILSALTGTPLVQIATITILITLACLYAERTGPPLEIRTSTSLGWTLLSRTLQQEWNNYSPPVKSVVLIAGAIWSVFLAEAITRPPSGWDAQVYHLPLAATWLQRGMLTYLEESWKFQMPSNGELILLFSFYTGSDRVTSFATLPFGILAVLTIYRIAFRLSGSGEHAALAAIGFATMPVILYNMFEANLSDMFAATFFLVSVYLLALLITGPLYDHTSLITIVAMSGIAFGLSLGARYVYVPLLPFMLALSVGTVLVRRHEAGAVPHAWGDTLRLSGTFLVFAAIPSGFWYVRNLLRTGNPLHPLHFTLDSHGLHVVTRGLRERADTFGAPLAYDHACIGPDSSRLIEWVLSPWIDCWYAGDHFSINWGLGPVFATMIPTIALMAVVYTVQKSLRERAFTPALYWVMTMLVFLSYWWIILFKVLRFMIPALALLFVCMAIGIGLLSARGKRLSYYLLLGALMVQAVLVLAKPLQLLSSRVHHNTWSNTDLYEVPAVIESLPEGSVILNASNELKNYGLFGSRRQNRVVTDRALLEPQLTTSIDRAFIERWGITHLYIDSSQKWSIARDLPCRTIHEREIDQDGSSEVERVCQVEYK